MPNKNLIEALNRELAVNKLQHVQMLVGMRKGRYTVKFTYVDTDRIRAKLKAITERYCESLELVEEKKTTIIYAI